MNTAYIIIPVVSTLIGWLTNVVAVKMLFRPRRPLNLLGWNVQGAVPKRQEALARSLAEVFDRELVTGEDLGRHFDRLDLDGEVSNLLDGRLGSFFDGIGEKIPMAKMLLNDAMKDKVSGHLKSEISNAMPEFKQKLGSRFGEAIDIRMIIEEKVRDFSLDRLEKMVMHVATKELKTIELLGGVLGLIIGLIQVAILIVIKG